MTRPLTSLEAALSGVDDSDYNLFEPFNVPPRPKWLLDTAKKFDVELDPSGSPFQTGMLLDTTQTPGFTFTLAGSQDGKSYGHLVEALIMASGQIPISLRYDKGVDTGIARKVTPENITRFGQLPDGSCGNIIGVGKYPVEKIPKPNSGKQIWICTFKEAREKMWKKKLPALMPPHFLDKSRGTNGFYENKQTYYFQTGIPISFLTYEQDYRRAEAERAWLVILDEEPPDRRFFISALEHSEYLRLCYTPINGLSWSYSDIYLPIIRGERKNVTMFSCSQYDSPYQKREKVDAKIKNYKPYEIKARVFGLFSDMEGKPYYTFDITQKFLKCFTPRHTFARILPMLKPETVREAIKIKMRMDEVTEPGEGVWEIYEQYCATDAYWLSADVGRGNENPDAASDASVAYIRRLPHADEKEPVMVATLYSRIRNVEFAGLCLYGAIYHNFALMCPEARGEDAQVFLTSIGGYPFIYRHTNINDKTRRTQEVLGFDTTGGKRKLIFDLVGTWLYDHADNSKIWHYQLLREAAECIVGKDGRPDHGDQGSTDCLVAFGISEYVYHQAKTQIRNNRNSKLDDTPCGGVRFPNIKGLTLGVNETRKVLGSKFGMDYRERMNRGLQPILQTR